MTAITARIILGMMQATGFLSMGITDAAAAATTMMMYAVGISVVFFVSARIDDDRAIRDVRQPGQYRRRRHAVQRALGLLLEEYHDIEISFSAGCFWAFRLSRSCCR